MVGVTVTPFFLGVFRLSPKIRVMKLHYNIKHKPAAILVNAFLEDLVFKGFFNVLSVFLGCLVKIFVNNEVVLNRFMVPVVPLQMKEYV